MHRFLLVLPICVSLVHSADAGEFELRKTNIEIEVATHTSNDVNSQQIVVALIPQFDLISVPVRATIVQSDAQFTPFVSIAQGGAVVELPNQDNFAHHVYSFSDAITFELPLYGRDQTQSITVKKSGIVTLGCNIHDWMLGYLFVVDTPYFTFLDENTARFDEIVEGDYVLTVWHPSMQEAWELPMTISPNQARYTASLPAQLTSVAPLPTPKRQNLSENY